ncbi:hypothetical protein [Lacibacter sp.]|uniref:hypothetical protein n=1 Tax=Lacibacter sp. TaxID=1915409 RepID=UPI002B4B423D|nr:hypothetical protein [Lacibacter sp.]HLP39251.1 hypothetical protein [Lacibacter sp.]
MFISLKKINLIVLFTCSSIAALAQEGPVNIKTPRFVSEKGYWVVKSNVKQPKEAVVYFYDLQHELVYKEELKNVNLNIKRTKVKMRLKRALEQAITAHERGDLPSKDEKIVAAVFGKN